MGEGSSSLGAQGYLHESALSTKELALRSSLQSKGGTSDGDIVLAGKGFDKALEKALAESDATLNFRSVDLVEKQRASEAELLSFLKQGKLGVEYNVRSKKL